MTNTNVNYRKRNGKWQARFFTVDVDGKRHEHPKSGFPTKSAAKKYAEERLRQQDANQVIAADPTFISYFDKWYKTYKEPKITDNTARHYRLTRKLILNHFGQAKIKKIGRMDYQEFINSYGENHAPESVRKVKAISHACIKSAVADGIIPRDIGAGAITTANKDHVMKVEYLNLNELSRLLTVLEQDRDPRYTARYMIITAIYTGARLAEIAALTWKDVDEEDQTISINKSWDYLHHGGFKPTKNKSSNRVIAVNQKLLDVLSDLKSVNDKLIFLNDDGDIPTSNGVNKVLRYAMKKAGINKTGFHFHSLRHAHVAYLISQDVDLYSISKRLGHSSVSTTSKVYAYLLDEYQQKQNDDIRQKLQQL